MEIKPAPYRFHDLINDVGTMVRVRAEQKGLSYVQKIDPAIPDHLIGDELRIRQIMINLLNNAVKYTDSGEVEMGITMKDLTENSLSLCICVRDTGIGIKDEDISRIFGDFQRLDEKHNHKVEGTGLGLSIVKRMLGLMNGEISVSSKYGEGSVFTALIPQQICSGPGETVSDNEKHGGLADVITYHTPEARYLVVDDNRLNLLVARRFLDGLNGQIDTARSGDEAL